MKFDQIDIGHRGIIIASGREFTVKGFDDSDETVMDENGTWFAFSDCEFPTYEY